MWQRMSPQELQTDGIHGGVMKIPVIDYYSVQLLPYCFSVLYCLKLALHLHKFDANSEHTVINSRIFRGFFFGDSGLI